MSKKSIKGRKKKSERRKKARVKEQRQEVLATKQTPWQMYLTNAKDSQILNIGISEIKSLKDKEYKLYLQRLSDIANARAEKLIEYGYGDVYSVQHYYNEKVFGSGNYTDRQSMIKEVNRINNFLNSGNSSIEDIDRMLTRAERTFKERTGIDIDLSKQHNRKSFFAILDRARAKLPREMIEEFYQDLTEFSNDFIEDFDPDSFNRKGITSDENTQIVLDLLDELIEERYLEFQTKYRQPLQEEVELWDSIERNLENRLKYDY